MLSGVDLFGLNGTSQRTAAADVGDAHLHQTLMSSDVIAAACDAYGLPEMGVRLVLSLLAGYPVSLVYRAGVRHAGESAHHLYFALTGFGLLWFNFGLDSLHLAATVLLAQGILLLAGGSVASVVASYVVNMAYLYVGYIQYSSLDYSINWTMPHCVLTLRLIGLTLDVYDGVQDETSLTKDQQESAVDESPSLLETFGFCLFTGGCLIGPQFSLRQYRRMVRQEPAMVQALPQSFIPGMSKLGLGLAYLALHTTLSYLTPTPVFYSDNFYKWSFWWKCCYVAVWCRATLYKYVGCWLLAEGQCIWTGLSYSGTSTARPAPNSNKTLGAPSLADVTQHAKMSTPGEPDVPGGNGRSVGTVGPPRGSATGAVWNACCNIQVARFESSCSFQEVINSFNLNTNRWIAKYCYKRLKFLGNRSLSQVIALAFLAMWHGYFTGYYATFATEYFVIKWEKDLEAICRQNHHLMTLYTRKHAAKVWNFLRWCFVSVFMGYCLLPFVLLAHDRWRKAWFSMYFVGHVMWLTWPFLAGPLRVLARTLDRKQSASMAANQKR